MKLNIVVFILFVIIYVVTIVLTIFKIKDIHKNPEKYEHEDLINETNRKYANKWDKFSSFFKSLSHQYGMVNMLLCFIFVALGTIFIFSINKAYSQGEGYITLGTQLIGSIGLLFLGIPLCMIIIPLAIKKPFFVVTTLDMFNTDHRPKIYFKGYILFLVFFIITFPFITLSCNNYVYYDSNGIYSNRYFQIEEKFTSYEEITKIEIYLTYKEEKISGVHYDVYLNDGRFNINSPSGKKKIFADNTFAIHNYVINKSNCEFIITPLTEDDINFLVENYTNDDYQKILEVFNADQLKEN